MENTSLRGKKLSQMWLALEIKGEKEIKVP